MIEWKGLFANTPYSSANNKTQDDAVVGMQDTIYVTGPGYGGYEANVRVHNASGAVVAQIPVCGAGGALSAPAPVRILDDSTTYSYSLEVVRGAVPSDDPDKIVIRIIGGASKRYPGQASTLPDGSTSFAGPASRAYGRPVAPTLIDGYLRPASFGDSTADHGLGGNNSVCDTEKASVAFPGSGYDLSPLPQTMVTAAYWQPSIVVANGGFMGNTVQNMLDRSKLAWSTTRKALEDVAAKRPHVVLFHGASINDYLGMTAATPQATIDAVVAKHIQMVRYFTAQGILVIDSGCYGYSVAGPNLPAICSIIVQTNATLKAAAANDPLWRFIDTSGVTHDGTGLFIPTMTGDGTHLSALGGYWIGKAEHAIISEYYIATGRGGNTLWDQQQDYANAVANCPANCSLGYDAGKTSIVSQSCDASKLVVKVHATAQDTLQMYLTNPQSKALAKVKAGDALAFECDYSISDLDGNPLIGYGAELRILLTDVADNNVAGPFIVYDRNNSICTHNRWVRQFSTPVDAANLGPNNTQIFGGPVFPAGDWVITFRPWRVVRYTPLNALPIV